MSTTITAGNATNNGASIASDTAGTIEIKTGSTPTTAITVDTSQNVGIGLTPFANSISKGLDLVNGAGAFGYSNGAYFTQNCYYDGAWKYKSTGAASAVFMEAGVIKFNYVASGTAGASFSPTEAMRIDTSGNLLLGQTSSAYANAGRGLISINGSSEAFVGFNTGGNYKGYLGNDGTNFTLENQTSTGYIRFLTNSAERMRITSTGIACIGTTGSLDGQLSIYNPLATYCLTLQDRGTTGGIRFNNPSSTQVGAVYIGSSSTTYATTSDYRLKENVAPMTGALAKISALKPVTYTWKSTGNVGEGFIAHELAEVCPDAVAGEKDAVDEEGNPKYQGIDTSFLVATLTAAIQELNAKVDAQAAEIAALKGAK